VQIDQQQITLTNKRLGIPAGRPQLIPRKEITRLECHPATASSTASEEPCLTLCTGPQKYELKGHPPLTPQEINWLAYELSTWLKVPVIG
jgi:hypothetical protein